MSDTAWGWVIVVCVAAGFVMWLIVASRQEAAKCEREAAADRGERRLHNKQTEEAMQRLALTCRRCGKLAMPIVSTISISGYRFHEDTSNRYRCEHCGNQFTNVKHNLFMWSEDSI
jgi:hypothetical protein